MDDEVPVEETPGYVGNVFDNEFMAGEELKPLQGFDWSTYGIVADELGMEERELTILSQGKIIDVAADVRNIQEIVELLPTVEAIYDCPPNQGPAGGSGYVFVLADGKSIDDVRDEAAALRLALEIDLRTLQAKYEAEGLD